MEIGGLKFKYLKTMAQYAQDIQFSDILQKESLIF